MQGVHNHACHDLSNVRRHNVGSDPSLLLTVADNTAEHVVKEDLIVAELACCDAVQRHLTHDGDGKTARSVLHAGRQSLDKRLDLIIERATTYGVVDVGVDPFCCCQRELN